MVNPSEWPSIGTVDPRYQSYNIEMVEVTGGRFWRPYTSRPGEQRAAPALESVPTGMDPNLYEYRPPVDLYTPQLRTLAAALGPVYVRVSGTWSNRTYVPAIGEGVPGQTPAGYGSILTPAQWKGVIDFTQSVNGKLVTSFAIADGVRDRANVWTPFQAQRLLDLTRALGGSIHAAEFFNEPNLARMGGAPEGYTAEDYGRDFQRFHDFMRQAAPELKIAGPGSVMESTGDWMPTESPLPVIPTPDLMAASNNQGLDVFSYHHYGALSVRCAEAASDLQTASEAALSEQWLRRTDETLAFYKALRDQYTPNIPIWLTETAEAACGGNRWANTFLDTFRYLDQLGRLATQEVSVVMHNTLFASDYSLIHEDTLKPKPNYWGAVLWAKLMGTIVLGTGTEIQPGLHLYAHSLPGTPGGVTVLAINNSETDPTVLSLPFSGDRYTLSAPALQAAEVLLNGKPLTLRADGTIPDLVPEPFHKGELTLEPATITFLAFPEATNPACT